MKVYEFRSENKRFTVHREDEAWRCERYGFTHGQIGIPGQADKPCLHLLEVFAKAKAKHPGAGFASTLKEARAIGRVARSEAADALKAGDLEKARDDMRIVAEADLFVVHFKMKRGRR